MTDISASLVSELRQRTGAGFMDCKRALVECKGNVEEASDWLRKKGIAKAEKKSGRTAADGLVAASVSGTKGAIIELNSETDFVARNEQFQALAGNIAQIALTASSNDIEVLKNAAFPGKPHNVQQEVIENIATIGENMSLRRVHVLQVSQGVVAYYIHNAVKEGLGKIAVLVALESSGDETKLRQLGKQIAMHVAASRPEALNVQDVDASKLQREKDILVEQAKASGKTEEIALKMVDGRIRKYYEEVVLLEQPFVMDGKTKVSQVVADTSKEIGAPITVKAYACFRLGEGIEKETSDFAAEVAAAAGN